MPDDQRPVSKERARAAKDKAMKRFERLGEVVGVGLTKVGDDYALKVNLKTDRDEKKFPSTIDGVPVRVEVVGTIRKRADE
ncbi:MAG: hypothetical protein WEE89_06065 [Gemmatimonadota bacterium]